MQEGEQVGSTPPPASPPAQEQAPVSPAEQVDDTQANNDKEAALEAERQRQRQEEEERQQQQQQQIITDETAARDTLLEDDDRIRLVAAIGRCVWLEASARDTILLPLEAAERAQIAAACSESFEEALEMDRLHMALQQAEKELEDTETAIHASEVLLAYCEKTTEETKQWKGQLGEHETLLGSQEGELRRVKGLLAAFPPAENETLGLRITALETEIEPHREGDREEDGQQPAPTATTEGQEESRQCAVAALEKQWEEVRDHLTLTSVELDALSSMPALQRCDVLLQRHQALVSQLTAMYDAHATTVQTINEQKTTITAELQTLFEKEIKSLVAPRKQLQQIEDEQLYHIRRGTFVKERQVDSTTHEQLATKKVNHDHTQLCTKLLSLKADIRVVQNEVRDLKRSLEDLENGKQKTRAALEMKLIEMSEDAEAFETMRLKLQEESEDLKGLRVELMKVLQFAKLQKKV